jgi:hypothetical protein
VPDRRDVLGQPADLFALGCGQPGRLMGHEPGVLQGRRMRSAGSISTG